MVNREPRFLVLRGGAIGDFVVTLPALQALRERWPDAYIELSGYPHIAELARAGNLVDEVTSLDRVEAARLFAARAELPQPQADHLRSFDVVITYLYDPDGIVLENLERAGVKQVICASPIVESGHAVDHLVRPLVALAIFGEGSVPRLRLPETGLNAARARLRSLFTGDPIALHPGSGSPAKNWPLERFLELAHRVSAEGMGTAFFLLGEADEAIRGRLSTAARDCPVLSNLSLVEVAEVLAASAAYVGNDSGISHLAAAVGLPTVCIFGPSNAGRWGPRGERSQVVCAPDGDLQRVTVNEILDLLRAWLPSRS